MARLSFMPSASERSDGSEFVMSKKVLFQAVIFTMLVQLFPSDFGANASTVPPELVKFQQTRTQIASDLAAPIAICVAHHDTDNPAFHGCMDWHSAVHGVWALSAYSW